MELFKKIKTDQIEALKAKEELKNSTLRMILSVIQNEEIEKRSKGEEIIDEDIEAILRREAKKRKESIEIYRENSREDLAQREEDELGIIEEYLPEQMSEEELRKIVEEESEGKDNFGQVMGAVMKRASGRADSSLVTRLVKESIEN
ncbi:MAG: glutamyl-tRNA amidotransferase [Candidatus Colwellbacteria bacterium CG10_big_fil_rev_8_21_14_0_10_41_28]|uniref:Glutamyl-tRNA amidotransferase n=1 Tax=Candidatus Colwellbacteria bacterium CG10_big_fil_rev_8_21_14_0_10_41_28 TaxID=1974539 RepID=A0A2H0VGZ3_9BACT|nr:MAG: glutamyl-tRNA amidotransferase [Candidatus Colwellbacteria bacterium CG10_big_fil_rev_8_21_14_0_10_41_28]